MLLLIIPGRECLSLEDMPKIPTRGTHQFRNHEIDLLGTRGPPTYFARPWRACPTALESRYPCMTLGTDI